VSEFNYNWTLKDANFKKDKGTVFSCFSCGGGSTMGYKLAGFDVIGCNEIDPKMMEVYKLNHNPKFSYLESIETFKNRDDLPKELYNLDILDGSPPCSSFSMSGNREKDWGKKKKFREGQKEQVLDNLFFDFIDLSKKLQPKVVIAENVKGLLQGNAFEYVQRIYKEFEEAGYYCQHWLLDASKMGVPQKRERVFFVCLRKDLAEPFLYQKDIFETMPFVDFDFNLKPIKFNEIVSVFGSNKRISDRLLPSYNYCIKNKIKDFAKYSEVMENKRANFNWRLLFNSEVCDTLTSDPTIVKEDGAYLNDSELCQVGSYPLDYNFEKVKAGYLIGMSVPPVMTAQISKRIEEQWLSKLDEVTQ